MPMPNEECPIGDDNDDGQWSEVHEPDLSYAPHTAEHQTPGGRKIELDVIELVLIRMFNAADGEVIGKSATTEFTCRKAMHSYEQLRESFDRLRTEDPDEEQIILTGHAMYLAETIAMLVLATLAAAEEAIDEVQDGEGEEWKKGG